MVHAGVQWVGGCTRTAVFVLHSLLSIPPSLMVAVFRLTVRQATGGDGEEVIQTNPSMSGGTLSPCTMVRWKC